MSVRLASVLLLLLCLSCSLIALAQEPRSDFNLGVQAFIPFHSSSSTVSVDSNISGGGILGYRLHIRGHSSAEVNYAYNRNTFYYTVSEQAVGGGTIFLSQLGAVHQITADYVYNINPWHRIPRLQPFVFGGGGVLIFRPISNATNTVINASTQGKGTFLFGGGFDYPLFGPLSFRLQYRGMYFRSPDFFGAAVSAGSHMMVAVPTAEVVFHF